MARDPLGIEFLRLRRVLLENYLTSSLVCHCEEIDNRMPRIPQFSKQRVTEVVDLSTGLVCGVSRKGQEHQTFRILDGQRLQNHGIEE
jgi:hypothetical protein